MPEGFDAGDRGKTMADNSNRKTMRRRLADFQLLSFLPIAILIAFWTRIEAVLFVVSFMFPLLLAFQELLRKPSVQESASVPPVSDLDSLTGLPNRRHMLNVLEQFLETERNTGRETAVLYVDLDKFRMLNDRFGLETGDRVLQEAAKRIENSIREQDVVARVDGDAFAIVLYPIRKADFAIAVSIADRIRAVLSQPFNIDQVSCYLTCSIGICLSGRSPDRDAESVLSSAEIALALARRDGPGATRSFSPRMRRESQKLHSLSAELEAALENGQICPYFQPQISAETGEISGFEALARWEHPENGVVLPDLFLKAIETAGRAERLGEVILYHSLSALKSWDRAGFRVPGVSVNFCSSELRNPSLVEKIQWEVDRFEIPPERITIEILENVVSDNDEDIITRNVSALAAQGFRIDLDDFGVGAAAIANIKRFSINRIKIDRSFITHIDTDPQQKAITSAILRMADCLGIDTLAEGVETLAEQVELNRLGCRYIQGFGVAKPMPHGETIQWLQQYTAKRTGLDGGTRMSG